MPHVIISGMPGIGKTTSVLCLARQLLGPVYKEAVLELNASDERGTDYLTKARRGLANSHQVSMWYEIESRDSHRRRSLYLLADTSSLSSMKPTA